MRFRIRCPHCDALIEVRPELAGRRARCPKRDCRQEIQIPGGSTSAEPPKATAAKTPQSRQRNSAAPQELPPPRRGSAGRQTAPRRAGRSAKSRPRRALAWWAAATVSTAVGALLIILGMQVEQGVTPSVQAASAEPAAPAQNLDADVRPFFEQFCYDCHSGDGAEGELNFEAYADVAAIQADRRHWERVYDRLRVGAMPPSDAEQPPEDERLRVVDWLHHALFFVDCNLAIPAA